MIPQNYVIMIQLVKTLKLKLWESGERNKLVQIDWYIISSIKFNSITLLLLPSLHTLYIHMYILTKRLENMEQRRVESVTVQVRRLSKLLQIVFLYHLNMAGA